MRLRLMLSIFALWLCACGYYTVFEPSPKQLHQGPSYPIRLAVKVQGSPKLIGTLTRGELEKAVASATGFFVQYFQTSRLFRVVDTSFPADAELYVTLTRYDEKEKDSNELRSRDNTLNISIAVSYKLFSKYLPSLSRSGKAIGASFQQSAQPLILRDYQHGNTEALNQIGDSLFGDLEEAFHDSDFSQVPPLPQPKLKKGKTRKDSWKKVPIIEVPAKKSP